MRCSEPADATPPAQPLQCSSCAAGGLRRERVSTALWRDAELVVIENIPALVCELCGERYFEDETAIALDMMRAGGQAGGVGSPQPERMMSVPVYAYAPPGGSPPREERET